MTIGTSDKLSLLAQRPSLERLSLDGNTPKSDELFSKRLQQALDSNVTGSGSISDKAQVMAQLLNLQMLQSSLSLSGDSDDAIASKPGRFSPAQAFIDAYRANSPPQKSISEETPSQEPQNISQTQMQDLAVSSPDALPHDITKRSASTEWLEPIVNAASKRYGVDAGLIKAVIKAESDFNPQAVSHAGAKGLMQLMPGTARSLGVNDSFDPVQNVMGGTRFLRDMLKRYDGNLDSALAAYNWGPGNVDRRPDSLPRETRNYQARVKQLYAMYSA